MPGPPPLKSPAAQTVETPYGEEAATTSSDSALPIIAGEKEELRPKYNFPFSLPRYLSPTPEITHYVSLHSSRLLLKVELQRKKSAAVPTEVGQNSNKCPSIL